jgi:hypothetical protein
MFHRSRLAWPVPVAFLAIWLFFVGQDIQSLLKYCRYLRQVAEWQKGRCGQSLASNNSTKKV